MNKTETTTGMTFARQCPDCSMYRGMGAATDLTPPCSECLGLRRDRAEMADTALFAFGGVWL